MATNNKLPKQLPLAPEVIPPVPEALLTIPADGPEILLMGPGAEKVVFTINPKATRYVVHADGLVLEDM